MEADAPKTPPGLRPTTGALLFEIRELRRSSTAYKFRYSQLSDATKKAAAVRAWREVHHKKAILKIVCRSCYAQREVEEQQEREKEEAAKRRAQEIPTPPVLPQWLVQSAIHSALKTCPSPSASLDTTTTPMPNPPPMPTWIMLQAAKKALRPNASSQKHQQTASLPHPPPLPTWVQSMILKETRNKLRPNNNKVPLTYRPNYCLQNQTKTKTKAKNPQPPPLPAWVHSMVLKQTKNKLRKQLVPRPSIPLSKTLCLHHHFLVSARQSLRSVDLLWTPPTKEMMESGGLGGWEWGSLSELFLSSDYTLSVSDLDAS